MKKETPTRARGLLVILVALSGVAIAAVVPAFAGDRSLPSALQEARAAAAKYHSFEQAERDGYTIENEPCVSAAPGTMGIHAINPALLSDGVLDASRPEVLLYVPKPNGSLKLVGVEYWQADADQNLATSADRPSLFGRAFDGPMPGHSPGMPIHYDLHVWVAEHNPDGVFALFNPAISC